MSQDNSSIEEGNEPVHWHNTIILAVNSLIMKSLIGLKEKKTNISRRLNKIFDAS